MEIKFLGTGSAGNCIAIQIAGITVLVDIGVPKTKVEQRLLDAYIHPGEIDAIFLTHAHGDHVKGLPFAEKWNIPVYASDGTWKSIPEHGTRYEGTSFTHPTSIQLTDFIHVDSFRTHHDDFDSYGYVILDDEVGEKVSVCLDTGSIDDDMIEAMRGSDIYVMECNYDENMLEASNYHDALKARIASDVGHLSNEQVAEALTKLVTGKGEQIWLCHMSNTTNMPVVARMTVNIALRKKGLQDGKHYVLGVV